MKTKSFTLSILSIFTLVFLIGLVNAAVLEITPITVPSSVNDNSGSFTGTYNVTYTGAQPNVSVSFTGTSNFGSVSIPSTTINQNDSEIVTATFTLPSGHGGQSMAGTINATGTGGSTSSTAFSVSITSTSTASNFCAYDGGVSTNQGKLGVKIKDLKVTGFGDDKGNDEIEVLPLDEIEVEVKVENKGNFDVDDISIEWGLAESDLSEFIIDLDEVKEVNIKDGDEEIFTFTFTITEKELEVDFDELGSSYVLFVRATGTIDDNNAGALDGQDTCASTMADVRIEQEDNFVVLYDLEFTNNIACGSELHITADVYNIGDRDQDDVAVKISNAELGISELVSYNEIEAFKDERLDVFIEIPEDADEKSYVFNLEVIDEDGDVYENDYDSELSRFNMVVTVVGSCGVGTTAVVSASLESGGKAGESMAIKATITNPGDSSSTYNINAAGFASWANSVDVSPETLIIGAGESRDTKFVFDVKKDASGEKTFNIEVLSEGQFVMSQPVSVQIEKSGFSLGGEDPTFMIIGIILTILILVAIIILIVRLAK